MTEPDVTLTNYALTLICAFFVWNLASRSFKTLVIKKLWLVFFSSVAIASLTAGTVHGFFQEESTTGYQVLWPFTLLAIGVTASSAWVLAGLFAFGERALKGSILFSAIVFIIYTVVVLAVSQSFIIVIINYLPPMALLLLVTAKEHRWIAVGIGIGFIGAYVQQAQIAIDAQYFNHNSTYHLIQAFSLTALFYGAKKTERCTNNP